jgi:predicted nucleotidyltransferase
MPEELRGVLERYRALLVSRFGDRVLAIRLFGSRARGDASEESDADVCVVVRDLTEPERSVAIDLAFEAWAESTRSGPLLSPLVWSDTERADRLAAERRIALDVEEEGISI